MAAGVLDYRDADIYDPLWQRKKRWLVLALYRQKQISWRELRLQRLLGMLPVVMEHTPSSLNGIIKESSDLLDQVFELQFGDPPTQIDPVKQASSQWEEAFACSLNDPETQRNIEIACQGLAAARSKK